MQPAEETAGSDVYYVKGGEPFTDRKRLASVLEERRGDVCVCDPYFGLRYLDAIEVLTDCVRVRCLTRQFEKGGKERAEREIENFKKQYPTPQFRVSDSADLHDRYVLADNGLLLLGHGLKDFGNKESFLIMLDEEFAPLETVKATFEAHWAEATALG